MEHVSEGNKERSGASKGRRKSAGKAGRPRSDESTKIPVVAGLAAGESRTVKLDNDTAKLIGKLADKVEGATVSDVVFAAASQRMSASKNRAGAKAKFDEKELQLQPAVWAWLETEAAARGCAVGEVIKQIIA